MLTGPGLVGEVLLVRLPLVGAWLGSGLAAVLAGLLALAAPAAAAPAAGRVYAVAVKDTVEPGLAGIVGNALRRAEAEGAAGLALVVDTPGGQVDAAVRIRDALLRARVPTVAFVEGRAVSAGALIALAAEKVYMAPGSQMGDAEPIPYSDKAVAYVAGEFKAVAEARGRDPQVAAAMVDKALNKETGKPLTLSYREAQRAGMADGEARDLAEALARAGLPGTVVWYEPSLSEQAARFLTQPLVAVLLLVIGVTAAAIEFVKPGVTLPGLIAVVALGAFFASHYLLGSVTWLEVGLVLLGLLLLAVEIFVPGFGVFGVAGIVSVLAGVFLSAPTRTLAAWYAAITLLGATVAGAFLVYRFSRHGLGHWLTLQTRLDTPHGYVPQRQALAELTGARGTALTPLRPAGVALFGEQRVDVVTEGEFLPAQTAVVVLKVEGTRVVVRAAVD